VSFDSPLFLPLLVLVAILIVRLRGGSAIGSPDVATQHSFLLPVVVGLCTSLLTAWILGGLRAPAVVHDEAAYLLQAAMLARGRWSLPASPEFAAFSQAHVLVTPVVAAKYPIGQAIALVPGMWFGLPGLMPVILAGVAAAFIVVLARRIWNANVAMLAVALWLTQAGQWRWRASYFSESTTLVLWLAGWWFLLRWREERQTRWLVALAAATGLGAVTRPLTMLAFAIPVGVVVLRDVARTRHWRSLGGAIVTGTVVLMLLPLQNIAVLGTWRQSPLALYTRQYLPFDRVGFGADTTSPLLPLAPDMQAAMRGFVDRHQAYQPAAVPAALGDRLGHALGTAFSGWRITLAIAAICGLFWIGAAGWFAVASMLALYVAYLAYVHEGSWTLYYYETTPVLALVIAVGLERLLRIAVGGAGRGRWLPCIVAAGIILADSGSLAATRRFRAADQSPFRRLQLAADSVGSRSLIFIRYGADHDPQVALVRNVADPVHATFVTAYDRGPAANARVVALFPDRVPLVWDDAAHRLMRAGQ
jgi:hypothetical protein